MSRDRIDALKALSEKVEAGGEVTARLWMQAFGIGPDDRSIMAARAYHGSLDAAKALFDALLPKQWYGIHATATGFSVSVHVIAGSGSGIYRSGDGQKCPARAWLLCIIKVEIWKEEQ